MFPLEINTLEIGLTRVTIELIPSVVVKLPLFLIVTPLAVIVIAPAPYCLVLK